MYIRTSIARRRGSGGGPGEECARTPVGTYFYLHAVGDGHHVAVPCLAWWAAKRGTGSCDPWDQQHSGSHVGRVLENHNIRTRARGSPAQPFQYVFSSLNTRRYSPNKGAGAASTKCFWRRRVRSAQRWDEGVGAGGGQLGSSAKARRSLAVNSLVSFASPQGARLEATQDGGGSQPEERHGMGAEVIMIIRRRKPRYGGFLEKCSRTHHLLRSGDSIHVFYQPLP
jgi:hypothetical protein